MVSISVRENREIEAANASGNTPVVFIHGLWLLPSSWANGADFFQQAGYAPLTPDWPDDPETVDQARANPKSLPRRP
jgi:non-heme chloroperoxidase